MKKSFKDFLSEEANELNESSTFTKAFALAQYLQFRTEKSQLMNIARQLKDTANAIQNTKDPIQLKNQNAKIVRQFSQSLVQITEILGLLMNVSATAAALAGKDKSKIEK